MPSSSSMYLHGKFIRAARSTGFEAWDLWLTCGDRFQDFDLDQRHFANVRLRRVSPRSQKISISNDTATRNKLCLGQRLHLVGSCRRDVDMKQSSIPCHASPSKTGVAAPSFRPDLRI